MPITQYCAQADIQNRLSTTGVNLRVDDTPPTTLGDVLNNAASIIDEHCRLSYDPATMVTSEWVKQRATDVAAYLLCTRRGNPAPGSIEALYTRTMARLEQVRLGVVQIPDIPARKNMAPVLSNQRVKLTPFPHVVTERNRSTGTPAGYDQHTDPQEWYDYSI